MAEDTPSEWLRPQLLKCGNCGSGFYRVDHSPLCDDYRLYCDSCSRAVEIGFYDPVASEFWKALPERATREELMAALEPRLRACACGGRYRDRAARRCFNCNSVVLAEDVAGVDLYPAFVGETQGGEPTAEDGARYEQFEREYVRTTDVWA